MAIKVRFMTLSGKLATQWSGVFQTTQEALKAAEDYVKPHGFTCVKLVNDPESDDMRITAKTPGGRGGRNVAFIDWDDAEDFSCS